MPFALNGWCSGRDSNPHGLLHTPLKRARLPITPPEQFDLSKLYFLAGGLIGIVIEFPAGAFAAVFALGNTVVGVALAFASAGAAVFAFASAGDAVFAFASAVFEFEFAADVISTGVSGLLDKTEMLPVSAGIARNKADNMKTVAATIVTLDKTVAVPRGANAELDTLLVKSAPASVLPGWSKTAPTRTMHEVKNNPYKK